MTVLLDQHLNTRVLTSTAQLEPLTDDWRMLWQQAGWATPFQRPEWLLPWCRHWATEGLHVWTLWRGDALVAMAPWRIDLDAQGRRRGMLLGAGLSDYLDVLVAPACESLAAAALREHLANLRAKVDLLELPQLAPHGFLARWLVQSKFAEQGRPSAPCPVLKLTSGAALESCLPAGQWKKLAYYRRRLARSGVVHYERASEENFDAQFSALVRLHSARWRRRDEPGVLADAAVEQFHREAARRMLEQGLLRQFALRLDSRVIAVYYGLHAAGRSYFYLSGFDPEFRQLSPGMLVVGYAIEQALAEQANAFDFLRGQEDYKYDWGAGDQPTCFWRLAGRPAMAEDRRETQSAAGRPEAAQAAPALSGNSVPAAGNRDSRAAPRLQ